MKTDLFQCQQTEDLCPANTAFKVIKNRKSVFEGVDEEIEFVGFNTCGRYLG